VLIDAHHHLWQYNPHDYTWMSDAMSALRRDFLIPDLESVTRAAGVEGTIVVQARQTLEETEWLLEVAANCPVILGVTGWVPLCQSHASAHLERFAQNPMTSTCCVRTSTGA